jgi:hypothetical protein
MRKKRFKKKLSAFELKIAHQRTQNFLQQLAEKTEREVAARESKERRDLLTTQKGYFDGPGYY